MPCKSAACHHLVVNTSDMQPNTFQCSRNQNQNYYDPNSGRFAGVGAILNVRNPQIPDSSDYPWYRIASVRGRV